MCVQEGILAVKQSKKEFQLTKHFLNKSFFNKCLQT